MKLNQYGSVGGVSVALALSVILLVASLIFGIWAFNGRQHYKNDSQQLVKAAVAAAKQQQQTADNKTFAIEEQKPLAEYVGPQAYGTITLYFPKNWSSYIDTSDSSGNPLDGYFYPGTLPSVTDDGTVSFPLRLQVESQSYATTLQTYENGQTGLTITPYALPKVPSVVGVEITGELSNNINGTLVILPLRTEALEVWTEGSAYLSEFNNDILPNLSFSP